MNAKKMLTLSFFPGMLMLLFSTPVFCAPSFTIQIIGIPYVSINPTVGYWTGIAINNQSSSEETFSLYALNDSGMQIAHRDCVRVPAKGIKADLLENFFPSPVSGRLTLYIKATSAGADRFEVTVFMGNSGQKNAGFAFQTYRSEDLVVGALIPCAKPSP